MRGFLLSLFLLFSIVAQGNDFVGLKGLFDIAQEEEAVDQEIRQLKQRKKELVRVSNLEIEQLLSIIEQNKGTFGLCKIQLNTVVQKIKDVDYEFKNLRIEKAGSVVVDSMVKRFTYGRTQARKAADGESEESFFERYGADQLALVKFVLKEPEFYYNSNGSVTDIVYNKGHGLSITIDSKGEIKEFMVRAEGYGAKDFKMKCI